MYNQRRAAKRKQRLESEWVWDIVIDYKETKEQKNSRALTG